jgi:hypothetical protein
MDMMPACLKPPSKNSRSTMKSQTATATTRLLQAQVGLEVIVVSPLKTRAERGK